ncbi:MAG: acetyltransferase [Acidobacteria bacterium]|nr:acetyltransferase [Acidobacteriota bacterium]
MKRVIIIGAGVHGREVAEILRHQVQAVDAAALLGFVDDDKSLHGTVIDEVPVLGDFSWFEGVDRSEVAVICASGFSQARRVMVERASAIGLSFANAISPLVSLSPNAKVGQGVVMCQNSLACRGSVIEDHALVNLGAIISHDTQVGRYATLNPGVNLAGNVTVGEGSYLGIGCSVIQGISIGRWTIVGAGAAVIRDLPDNVTAVGVPARIIKGNV